jgi:hypothetical protein
MRLRQEANPVEFRRWHLFAQDSLDLTPHRLHWVFTEPAEPMVAVSEWRPIVCHDLKNFELPWGDEVIVCILPNCSHSNLDCWLGRPLTGSVQMDIIEKAVWQCGCWGRRLLEFRQAVVGYFLASAGADSAVIAGVISRDAS